MYQAVPIRTYIHIVTQVPRRLVLECFDFLQCGLRTIDSIAYDLHSIILDVSIGDAKSFVSQSVIAVASREIACEDMKRSVSTTLSVRFTNHLLLQRCVLISVKYISCVGKILVHASYHYLLPVCRLNSVKAQGDERATAFRSWNPN